MTDARNLSVPLAIPRKRHSFVRWPCLHIQTKLLPFSKTFIVSFWSLPIMVSFIYFSKVYLTCSSWHISKATSSKKLLLICQVEDISHSLKSNPSWHDLPFNCMMILMPKIIALVFIVLADWVPCLYLASSVYRCGSCEYISKDWSF